jgi:hypothetical protein
VRTNVLTVAGTDDGARGIVEMLFCTSLIALVGAADQPSSSPRKLQIVNTKVRHNYRIRARYRHRRRR